MMTFKNEAQTAAVVDLCKELAIPFVPDEWAVCKYYKVRNTINGRRYEVDEAGQNVFSTESTQRTTLRR